MLIQTTIEDTSRIVHDGKSFDVVKGFAEVPVEIGQALIQFPHWNVVTEEVDKKILSKLRKSEKDKGDENSENPSTEV